MAITTTEFLASVKRNVTMPSNQVRFDDTDILAMADEQMQVLILPIMTSLRQEFFVVRKDVTVVAGQTEYKIPYRSVGRTLREIKVTDTSNTNVYTVPYVLPEDTQFFNYGNSTNTGDIRGYTIRGDNVVVLPIPASGTTQVIQMFYELAPSKLIVASAAGVVSSVDTGTGVVTMSAAVDGFATGQEMDLVDGESGNSVIAIDITNTNVSSTNVTFTAADLPTAPNALKAGDYVCLANQSPVLQIPNEGAMVLVQAVTVKLLEAQGDFEGMGNAERKLAQNIEAFEKIVTPRVEANVPTIVNTNGLIKNKLLRNRYFRYTL